jgi:hypothetical protein
LAPHSNPGGPVPISWKWMLLIALALLSMMFFPLVAVIYSGLVGK